MNMRNKLSQAIPADGPDLGPATAQVRSVIAMAVKPALDRALQICQWCAWMVACASLSAPLLIWQWSTKSVQAFAVTQTGIVIPLAPLDADKFNAMRSRATAP